MASAQIERPILNYLKLALALSLSAMPLHERAMASALATNSPTAKENGDPADHAATHATSGTRTLKVKFDDLPRIIGEKNNRVKSANLATEAQKNREGYLGRSFLPKLEIGAAAETFKQGGRATRTEPTYGGELSVSLFNGFQDSLENERRKTVTLERTSVARITQSEELQKARASFWRIIHTNLKRVLLIEAIKTNETNQKAADRRIRSGVATNSDRLEFEMRSVNLTRDLAATDLELSEHRRNLAIFLGESIETIVEPDATLEHQHAWKTELQHTESEHEFQIQNLINRRKEVEIASKLESRKPLPHVEAYAGYYQFNERGSDRAVEDERRESVIGLRLKMQIGDFWEAQKQSQSANIEAQSLQNQIDHQRLEIESHIVTEMNELSFLHSQVHAAEENVKRAIRYYQLTQNEYARGVKNSPDVVGASDRLLENQLLELGLLRDFQISRSHVLSKLGR